MRNLTAGIRPIKLIDNLLKVLTFQENRPIFLSSVCSDNTRTVVDRC
jgi:hypothetical protein